MHGSPHRTKGEGRCPGGSSDSLVRGRLRRAFIPIMMINRGAKMKETGNRTKRIVVFAVLALVVLVSTVAVEAAVQRSAPINRFVGVDEIVEACTTGTTFAQMPQMVRRFTVGGSVSEEVVVMFEGSLSLSGNPSDTGFIRLAIDGVQQTPGVVPAIGAGERGTHGFNWQSSPLSPGLHRARVQWRTDLGGTLCVDARSLIVLHV
jgi:hypothetical protein